MLPALRFQDLLAQADAGPTPGLLGFDLTAVFIFSIFGVVFVVATISILGRMVRPATLPEEEPFKRQTYECGEPAIGSSWVRFDIRFYTVALVFLIFDVEVAFLYPWAVVFKDLRLGGLGLFVFLEMLLFLLILTAGFVYCWKKGDLDWIKSLQAQYATGGKPGATEKTPDAERAGSQEEEVLVGRS